MMFSGTSKSSGLNAIFSNWSGAIDGSVTDLNEPGGPDVFRLEYYYVIRTGGSQAPVLSGVPWRSGHSGPEGLADVAALGVVIALIDAKARALLPEGSLDELTGAMTDFSPSLAHPGELEAGWRDAVKASSLPRAAASSIRIYRRGFYFSPLPLSNP